MNVAQLFVKCLETEEVEYVFGVPGGGKRPFHDGFRGIFNTLYSDPP